MIEDDAMRASYEAFEPAQGLDNLHRAHDHGYRNGVAAARVEWWDEPDRNIRWFAHIGCDEGNMPWAQPLDDTPPPTRDTQECARCCHVLPLVARPRL